jgi:hypothetical protein
MRENSGRRDSCQRYFVRPLLRRKWDWSSSQYAGKGTADFESCIDTGLGKWLASVEQRYADKDVDMDLGRQAHFATLDTLGEIAFGQPLGFVENNADQGNFLKINEAMLPILLTISNYSPVFKLTTIWPFKYLLPRVGDAVGLGAVLR